MKKEKKRQEGDREREKRSMASINRSPNKGKTSFQRKGKRDLWRA